MALTGSTNYNNALTSTIKEEWLFEFRNNTYNADATPNPNTHVVLLGTAEVGSGTAIYHSFITNSPSIRESIDLSKSTASVGNITLTCVNGTLANHGNATLAAEIYGGTRRYINHEVIVHSRVGGHTEQIFQGRLKDVKINGVDTLSMTIAVYNPIENIDILQHQSKSGNFYPVFYGTGSPETSTDSSPDFVTDARVFPVEIDSLNNDVYNGLAHREVSDGRLHYPVKDMYDATNFPMFVPLDDVQNASHDDYEGASNDTNKNVLFTDLDLEREYKIRPQTVSTETTSNAGLIVANLGNAYDATGAGTVSTLTFGSDASVTPVQRWVLTDLPKEEHNISVLSFTYTHQTASFTDNNGSLTVRFQVAATWNGSTTTTNIDRTANASSTPTTVDLLDTSVFSSSLKTMPDEIRLNVFFINSPSNAGSGTNNTAVATVKDMFLTIKTKIDQPTASDGTAEKLSKSTSVASIKRLYTGADGLTKSWSTSTVITDVLNMHRDLLYRFAGVTATPVVNNGKSLSDLETDRANWFCKYYTNKQVELNKLLEKVQFEGGFIHRFRPANQSSQYIYIDDSMSTLHTISKDDISNMTISITPIESLITKREIKYEVNPINDKTFLTQTCEDTTNDPRGDYNIATKENVETTELTVLRNKIGDANMGGTRNNGFANYYNAIQGNPKLIINTEIINPGSSGGSSYFYLMEVGDICAFSHTNQVIAPFGESFNGKQFIVQSMTRSPGSLKVTLREI